MTAADLIPGSPPPSVMSLSLYLPFKVNREEDRVTTQEETHLKDSRPARKHSFGEGVSRQGSVPCCSSRDTVNPSAEPLGLGAGVRAPGDRGRVFTENTRMFNTISTTTTTAAASAPTNCVQPRPAMYQGGWTRRPPRKRLRRPRTKGRSGMSRVSNLSPLYSEYREVSLSLFVSDIRYSPHLVGHVGHKVTDCCLEEVERFSPESARPTPLVHGWTGLDMEVRAA